MTDRFSINQLHTRIPPHAIGDKVTQPRSNHKTPDLSFRDVLNEQFIRFSHHAEQRLKQRGIEFKPEQMAKLATAVDKAANKGAKDSLIMIQDVALIVNVKHKMVVTAMDGQAMQDHVFTQIDSAVIVT